MKLGSTFNFTQKLGYAFTSRGEIKDKLDYTFDMYDVNIDGTLDRDELRDGIYVMLEVLGSDQSAYKSIADEAMKKLDEDSDKKVTREEFIDELSSNYSLRMLMSPFN